MKNFYSLKDSYKLYQETSKNPVLLCQYLKILNLFMKFLANKLLVEGEVVLLEKLGSCIAVGKKVKIRIEEGKIKGLAPDWVKTKELWLKDLQAKKINKLCTILMSIQMA